MRLGNALTGYSRVARVMFCRQWLFGANSRAASPGQDASRVILDLRRAGSKEDGTRRTISPRRRPYCAAPISERCLCGMEHPAFAGLCIFPDMSTRELPSQTAGKNSLPFINGIALASRIE